MNNMYLSLVGETAAVVTSCMWTGSSLFFTSAGKRIGTLSVNAYRTVIAVGFIVVTHLIVLGTVLPAASSGQWVWMGISGVVGLGIGDGALFTAYVMIGPRRSVLVYALAPIFASVGAYLMLEEMLPTFAIVGIPITLLGVVIVILEGEERSGEAPISRERKSYGVFFASVGAAGQGIGLALAKRESA
jgi:drug/metabolite transporter (DMT)-like permease